MTRSSSLRVLLATASVAVVALTASAAAQAQNYGNGNNVYWSLGMSAPGMQLGVANAAPMAMYPQAAYPQVMYPPVYAAPRPVTYNGYYGYYGQPAPVYYAPPVWKHHDHGRHLGRAYGYGHQMQRFEHGGGHQGGGFRH